MATTMQLAMGRWYDMSLAGTRFPVNGLGPCALAFDGEYIWVANGQSNNVSRLRACDGSVAGTYGVQGSPVALAFDGGSIWVSTRNPPSLVRLRAANGSVAAVCSLKTPPPEYDGPFGLAFDGAYLWTMWTWPGGGRFLRVRAADGVVSIGDAVACSGEVGASKLAYDGVRIWNRFGEASLGRFDAATGASLGATGVGSMLSPPTEFVFDGTCLWAGSAAGSFLARIDVKSGSVLSTYFANSGPSTTALCHDGQCVWQFTGSSVRRIRQDGTVLSDHPLAGQVGPMLGGGQSAIFDGAFMWVLGANNDVLKL